MSKKKKQADPLAGGSTECRPEVCADSKKKSDKEPKTLEELLAKLDDKLPQMRPIDDDCSRVFFSELWPDGTMLVQDMLRTITGVDTLEVKSYRTQSDLKVLGYRSVRMDILAEDAEGTKYDIELQLGSKGVLARDFPVRLRHNGALLDVTHLDAGDDTKRLPNYYLICVLEEDIWGLGAATYHLNQTLQGRKSPNGEVIGELPYNEGRNVIYVQGSYRGEDALGKLMHDMCTPVDTPKENPLFEKRAAILRDAQSKKRTKEMESIFGIWEEQSEERGRAQMKREMEDELRKKDDELRKKNKEIRDKDAEMRKQAADSAERMLADGLEPTVVAKYLDLPIKEVRRLQKTMAV